MLLGIEVNYYGILRNVAFGLRMEDFSESDHWEDKLRARPLSNYTCIIGRNSAGKSTLLDACAFIADSLRHGVKEAAVMHGRDGYVNLLTHGIAEPMNFSILLCNVDRTMLYRYELTLSADDNMRPYCAAERLSSIAVNRRHQALLGLSGDYPDDSRARIELDIRAGSGQALNGDQSEAISLTDHSMPAVSVLGRLDRFPDCSYVFTEIGHWYSCRFTGDLAAGKKGSGLDYRKNVRQLQGQHGGHRHLAEDGSNLANVLAWLKARDKKDYQRRLKRITEVLPRGFSPDADLLDQRIETNEERVFALMLLLQDPNPRPLLIIENPDSGLYYETSEKLNGLMRQYSLEHPESQIIITTHSVNFIDGFSPAEVWLMSREDETNQDSASITCIADLPYIDELFEEGIGLGALWYAGHFDDPGGRPAGQMDSLPL